MPPEKPIISPSIDPLATLLGRREQLLIAKEANAEVMASCRAKLDRAQASDAPADQSWLARVKTKLRYAGFSDQALARELAMVRDDIAAVHRQQREGDPRAMLAEALRLIRAAMDVINANGGNCHD